jgi:hypothetical protein
VQNNHYNPLHDLMLYLLYHNNLKRSILKLFTNNKMSGPPHPCPGLKTGRDMFRYSV